MVNIVKVRLRASRVQVKGNAEEAFTFYKSVFGGEFALVLRFKDMPHHEKPLPENDANRMMHIALPVGKGNVLMASDFLESMGQKMKLQMPSKLEHLLRIILVGSNEMA